MRLVPRIRWGRLILLVIASAGILVLFGYAVIRGVVATSFRYYPPTPSEIAEDPSLVRYLP